MSLCVVRQRDHLIKKNWLLMNQVIKQSINQTIHIYESKIITFQIYFNDDKLLSMVPEFETFICSGFTQLINFMLFNDIYYFSNLRIKYACMYVYFAN